VRVDEAPVAGFGLNVAVAPEGRVPVLRLTPRKSRYELYSGIGGLAPANTL